MTIGQRFLNRSIYPVFKDARAIFDERACDVRLSSGDHRWFRGQ